jgi:ATP:corrinoid adenosyltransferase
MEVEIPPYEVDDLIRKHSKTYRRAVLEFLKSYVKVGERYTLHHLTEVLEGHGYAVRGLQWWRQARILKTCSNFRRVDKTWQRVK